MKSGVAVGGVDQVRSDCTLDQTTPVAAVGAGFVEAMTSHGTHQRGVVNHELGRRLALTNQLTGVLVQPGQEPGVRQQRQLMTQRKRVTTQPALGLVQSHDLAGVGATEAEKLAQQGRLVHPEHLEYVLLDVGRDQRRLDIVAPACFVANEARASREAAEIEVLLQGEAESRVHFVERPMPQAHHLEATQETFRETVLHQHWRRTQQQHVHAHAECQAAIPQALHQA